MSETISLEQILNEIKINRNEIINKVEATEVKLLMTVETVNKRVKELEEENKSLKEEVEQLKREHKQNNVIIFGLNIPQDNFTIENICHHFETLIEVKVGATDINNFYKLGKASTSPIKVEFLSYLKKLEILRNCNKLKGKPVSIVSDQTPQQREESKTLRHHLSLAKNNRSNCYIKKNKLYIDGAVYTAEDLMCLDEEAVDGKITNSAPPTPVSSASKIVNEQITQTPKLLVINRGAVQGSDADAKKRSTRLNSQGDVGRVAQGKKKK